MSAGDSFANCVVKTPIQGELPALSRATPLAAIDKLVPVGVASNLYGEFADGEHAGALASRTLLQTVLKGPGPSRARSK